MPQYVALLRGINVTGRRVRSEQLSEVFDEIGLLDVSTFLASGNVIFSMDCSDVAELESIVEARLAKMLGFEVATFVRSSHQLEAISAVQRMGSSGSTLSVIFLQEPPLAAPHTIRSMNTLRRLATEFLRA